MLSLLLLCLHTLTLILTLSHPRTTTLSHSHAACSLSHTHKNTQTYKHGFILPISACMHATFLYSFLFVVMNVASESRVRHCMFANIPAAMTSVLMSIVDICEHHVFRCLFAHDAVLSNTAQRMRRRRRLVTRQPKKNLLSTLGS